MTLFSSYNIRIASFLIHLDGSVNSLVEPETGQNANGSAKESKANGDHAHVREVHDDGQDSHEVQSGTQKPKSVEEQISTGAGTIPKGFPPPTMIFTAQLQVAHDNGHFGTSGAQNQKDNQQESHNVVDLVQPKGAHNKGQFDADGTKWKDTSKGNGNEWVDMPWKFWNDTGNLVGLGGDIKLLGAKSHVGTEKDKRRRNAHPKRKESDNGQERHGRGGTSKAQKDVEDNKDADHASRKSHGGVDGVELPSLGVAKLVESGRDITSDGSAENVQDQDGCQGLSLVHGVEQFENGANHGKEESSSNLGTSTDTDGKKHGRELRWSKDITMDQLPSSLFLCLFQGLQLVVSSNILAQGADHDGSNSSRQEQDNHERIDNGKVVNVIIWRSNQVDIPTISPRQVGGLPLHFVTVENLDRFSGRTSTEGEVGVWVVDHVSSTWFVTGRNLGSSSDAVSIDLMLHRDGVDIKARDAGTLKVGGVFAVGDGETQVIVEVKLITLESRVGWWGLETNWISTDSVVEFLRSHENWKLIKSELNTVLSLYQLAHPAEFLSAERNETNGSTALVLLDLELKRGWLDIVSLETCSEVLTHSLELERWLRTNRKIIKLEWNLSFTRFHQIRINDQIFSGWVLLGAHSRE
mmetsp:Transcript_28535/g.47226  ORF Transcript_28535/g.47226 Transcript_28535/m.47226 type:complete len:637 (+) Transcript_28535:189-2099(+)